MTFTGKLRLVFLLLVAAGATAVVATLQSGVHGGPALSAMLQEVKRWAFAPRLPDLTRAASRSLPSVPRAFAAQVPARVVWAWEEPEDLRSLPSTAGVAYLAETLLLSEGLRVLPRRQSLRVAANAPLVAVVRVEAMHSFADSPELRAEAEGQLAQVALRPGVRALQIDFDATVSELPFYRAVLQALRPAMPNREPLSITALASWCGEPSWLQGLPIDEAVPMLFRMGGPQAMATTTRGRFPLRASLCRGSRGLSVDEPWPGVLHAMDPEARLYLFAPGPWQPEQLRAVAAAPLSALSEALEAVPRTPHKNTRRNEAAQ